MLVAASAMSPLPGTPGAPGTGAPGPGAPGPCRGSPGTTAVRGSRLPPDISAVGASADAAGGGVLSSSAPESGGANTVAGSATAPSSESALVSVPAHGAAPVGTFGAAAGTPS